MWLLGLPIMANGRSSCMHLRQLKLKIDTFDVTAYRRDSHLAFFFFFLVRDKVSLCVVLEMSWS